MVLTDVNSQLTNYVRFAFITSPTGLYYLTVEEKKEEREGKGKGREINTNT